MYYRPYDRNIEPPDGMNLKEYAEAWVDFVPHTDHLMVLASMAETVVEFGLRGGVSTWSILDGLPDTGHLYGVDIVPDFVYLRENNLPYEGYATPLPPRVRNDPRFTFILGNSVEVELPDHADLVMIDSSHLYDQTKAEIYRAAALKPKVIAMHDIFYTEVPDFKVAQAIEDYMAEDGAYRLRYSYPSKWGLAILTPRKSGE
jgi:predicted O-methyltransferase YrrM